MRTRPLPTDYKIEPPSRKAEQDFKVEYQVTSITPIYGGGVVAGVVDQAMPIRSTAIRGQLRFWWRLLKKYRDPNKPLSDQALFKAERAIWGGMLGADSTANKDDGPVASQIKVEVCGVKGVKPCDEPTVFCRNDKNKEQLGVKYALFSAIANVPDDKPSMLRPGLSFNLRLSASSRTASTSESANGLSQEQWNEVLEAVRWWANFGGIGARTRRGLGAVEVAKIEPLSPTEVERYGCSLHVRKSSGDCAMKAWNLAVAKLYQFRQGENIGRREGNDPETPKKYGRSYWPEPDTIRTLTGRTMFGKHKPDPGTAAHRPSYPRAMFGLPIIFDFQKANGEPDKTQLLPDAESSSRMASPLIIKPQAIGANNFRAIALLLPIDHLKDLKLKLDTVEGEKGTLARYVRGKSNGWWPLETKAQTTRAGTIEPMKTRSNHPLLAFLKFFES